MKESSRKVYAGEVFPSAWKRGQASNPLGLHDKIRRAMKQLVLNISPAPPPTFASFIVGQNQELCTLLQALANGEFRERFVYLWGAPGAGKSHLLGAFATAAHVRSVVRLDRHATAPEISQVRGDEVVIFDDVHRLGSTVQPALFHAYNRIRTATGQFIVSGALPPGQLMLLPDLKSRLGWGLVLEVKPLSDEEKYAALSQRATARGFTLTPEVIRYIVAHYPRDLPALMNLLAALDSYSLQHKRPITVPLLKAVIDQELTLES
jgi:DnaA-homolog protein